mgnify:CR=1 FL=1
MIRHNILPISNTAATSLDIAEIVKSSFTLVVQNINSDGYIYLGNPGVTSSNFGFRLSPNQAFTIEMPSSQNLYAIASDSGLSVSVMEIYRAI